MLTLPAVIAASPYLPLGGAPWTQLADSTTAVRIAAFVAIFFLLIMAFLSFNDYPTRRMDLASYQPSPAVPAARQRPRRIVASGAPPAPWDERRIAALSLAAVARWHAACSVAPVADYFWSARFIRGTVALLVGAHARAGLGLHAAVLFAAIAWTPLPCGEESP